MTTLAIRSALATRAPALIQPALRCYPVEIQALPLCQSVESRGKAAAIGTAKSTDAGRGRATPTDERCKSATMADASRQPARSLQGQGSTHPDSGISHFDPPINRCLRP